MKIALHQFRRFHGGGNLFIYCKQSEKFRPLQHGEIYFNHACALLERIIFVRIIFVKTPQAKYIKV